MSNFSKILDQLNEGKGFLTDLKAIVGKVDRATRPGIVQYTYNGDDDKDKKVLAFLKSQYTNMKYRQADGEHIWDEPESGSQFVFTGKNPSGRSTLIQFD